MMKNIGLPKIRLIKLMPKRQSGNKKGKQSNFAKANKTIEM